MRKNKLLLKYCEGIYDGSVSTILKSDILHHIKFSL